MFSSLSLILDPPLKPSVPVKELRTTLDGKHWAFDDTTRPSRRSQPPVSAGVDLSRAPAKPRPPSPATSTIPSRVLFPSAELSAAPGSASLASGAPPFISQGGDISSSGPPPAVVRTADPLAGISLSSLSSAPASTSDGEEVDVDDTSDDGEATVIFHPRSTLAGIDVPSSPAGLDRSCVIFHPRSTSADGDVSSESSPESFDRSFFEDFVPLGLSGSDLLAGSSAVLLNTAAALNTTVRQMFSAESSRSQASQGRAEDTARDRTRAAGDLPPPDRNRGAGVPPRVQARVVDDDLLPPTKEQFADIQQRYAAVQRQLDDLLSARSVEQRAQAIEDELELRRKAAYESAGIAYSPRPRVSPSPAGSPRPAGPGRSTEYRISHKSIGFLRPADASHHPFEAMEGDVYVRPLAWLAHLSTKLDLKEDVHYKNQVLQVASECLMGRAAAWWTAVGPRMRSILLSDYTLELWHQQIQVLCQSKEQTRKDALRRAWQVDREECWDYVWDKAALFEELDTRDRPTGVALISEILDGLPPSLARMCRSEFSPNPTVSDLTRELQILVPRWRKDLGHTEDRPRSDTRHRDRDRPPRPLPGSRVTAPRPPLDPLTAERPPLSTSYDRSRIGMQPHPLTKKPTRCYTKPNGRTIYLSRNCSRCQEAHFDFEHDTLRPAARFGLDECGYEEWDWDSDTAIDDSVAKKLN